MESLTLTQLISAQVESLLYDKLHQLLGVIAEDYDLSHGELVEKYLKYKNEVENPKVIYRPSEVVEPEKPKRGRKATVTTKPQKEEDREGKCEATTAKGTLCKNKALGGGCFCRVHSKKEDEEPKEKKAPRPKKTAGKALEKKDEKPKKRGRKPKKVEPEHNHALDEEHEECEACETFGNALEGDQEFELSEEDIKREALRELLKEELGEEDVTDEMLKEFEQEMDKEEVKEKDEPQSDAEEGEIEGEEELD